MDFEEKATIFSVNGRHLYRLHGVVCHTGTSTKMGHYTAFVRYGEIWYNFDDEKVNNSYNSYNSIN